MFGTEHERYIIPNHHSWEKIQAEADKFGLTSRHVACLHTSSAENVFLTLTARGVSHMSYPLHDTKKQVVFYKPVNGKLLSTIPLDDAW